MERPHPRFVIPSHETSESTEVSARKILNKLYDRVDLELYDTVKELKQFRSRKDKYSTQINILKRILKDIKRQLSQLNGKRNQVGHYFIGGLRALYGHLLDSCGAIKKAIMLHSKHHHHFTTFVKDVTGGVAHLVTQLLHLETHIEGSHNSPFLQHFTGGKFSVQMRSTAYVLLVLSHQLEVVTRFWDGEKFTPFKPLANLYPITIEGQVINANDVYGLYHFGYTYLSSVALYSKILHSVYSAVLERPRIDFTPGAFDREELVTLITLYFIGDSKSGDTYEKARNQLVYDIQRGAWDLLEDGVLNQLAQHFEVTPPNKYQFRKIPHSVQVEDLLTTSKREAYIRENGIYSIEDNADKPLPEGVTLHKLEEKLSSFNIYYLSPSTRVTSIRDIRDAAIDLVPIEPIQFVAETIAHRLDLGKDQLITKVTETVTDIFLAPGAKEILEKDPDWEQFLIPDNLILDEDHNVVLLHIHGGGWISQTPTSHISYLQDWMEKTSIPIVSVNYALSEVHKNSFAIALDQCFATYKWLLHNDPENRPANGRRIILAGDSAGGNLCLALTLRILQENLEKPAGLILSYPVVLVTLSGSISRIVFSNDPVLNYQSMEIVAGSYAQNLLVDADKDPFISPILIPDHILKQFPETALFVGELDPLLDDSTLLHWRLQKLGVPTSLNIYKGLPHGFLNLQNQLPNANLAIDDAALRMKEMVLHPKNTPN